MSDVNPLKSRESLDQALEQLLEEKLSDPKNLPRLLALAASYLEDISESQPESTKMLQRCARVAKAASAHISKEVEGG